MQQPPQPVRAIGYTRVSSSMQRDRGLSLDAQRTLLTEECGRRGWVLVHFATDVAPGSSTKKRDALNDALRCLDRSEADVLISTHLDRISRSVIDFAGLVERAKKRGWRLVVLDIDVDTTTPHGELLSNILASVAQWERRMLSIRVKEGLAERRRRGLHMGGYIVVSPAAQRRIMRMRARGMTFEAIAARLTTAGVPTPRGKSAVWCPASVRQIVVRLRGSGEPVNWWTPAEVERLRALVAQNASTVVIGLELGRSAGSVRKKRYKEGLNPNRRQAAATGR